MESALLDTKIMSAEDWNDFYWQAANALFKNLSGLVDGEEANMLRMPPSSTNVWTLHRVDDAEMKLWGVARRLAQVLGEQIPPRISRQPNYRYDVTLYNAYLLTHDPTDDDWNEDEAEVLFSAGLDLEDNAFYANCVGRELMRLMMTCDIMTPEDLKCFILTRLGNSAYRTEGNLVMDQPMDGYRTKRNVKRLKMAIRGSILVMTDMLRHRLVECR